MKLYSYWRSSTSYRARIALNLKGVKYDYIPVNILKGEQTNPEFLKLNPMGGVPTIIDNGHVIGQSLAIIDYLEQTRPTPALLPIDPAARAYVWQLSLIVACDVHPLVNMPAVNYVTALVGDGEKLPWIQHFTTAGLDGIEYLLANNKFMGKYCCGDTPTLADICLVPQAYAAKRFEVDLTPYPNIRRINDECLKHPAFAAAHPDQQIDAVK